MGVYCKVVGTFSKPLTEEQLDDLLDAVHGYGDGPSIDADGLCIADSMSDSDACAINELLKAFAIRHGVAGAFVSSWDGDPTDLFIGPEPLALASEEQSLIERIDALQARLDEVQKLLYGGNSS